jgi:hypothetical protein
MLPITIIVKLVLLPFKFKALNTTHRFIYDFEVENFIDIKDRE